MTADKVSAVPPRPVAAAGSAEPWFVAALAEAEACLAAGDLAAALAAARAVWEAPDPPAHQPPEPETARPVPPEAAVPAAATAAGAPPAADGAAGVPNTAAAAARPDDASRDRAGFLLASGLHRRSAFTEQLALAEALVPRLRRRGGPEFGEYLRWVVLAGCEQARFEVVLPLAYEVVALADADGSPRVRAMAYNAFAVCFERMGDPWQSERLMADALALAREAGTAYELFITLNNLCAVRIGAHYQLRGVGAGAGQDDADALLPLQRALPLAREAVALLPAVSLPPAQVIAPGNLGEILVHLGEHAEARGLLEASLTLASAQGMRPQQQRLRCSLAELALREGRPAEAASLVAQVLADEVPVPQTALRAHHAGYLAAQRLGHVAQALHHLEQHARIERQRSVHQLRAQSELFVTRVESERLRERARLLEVVTRHDPLTGLGNRREFDGRLPAMLQATQAAGQPLALAMLDIDTYKAINDRHGHQVGDLVLVTVAQQLRDSLRATDLVARLGGDEFVLVLPDASGTRALELCERIRARVAAHDWAALVPGLRVTVSIGVATTPPHDAAPLVGRADAALYRAKRAGRNRSALG